MMKRLAACIGAVLCACSPMRETAAWYTPVGDRFFPPLAKDAPVEVLNSAPSWPHEVIGKFEVISDRGYAFLERAMLYNARLQGADAVVIRRLVIEETRSYDHVPGRWENVPQTNVFYRRVQNSEGQWVTVPQFYTVMVPVFRPPRTFINDATWTDLKAEMIVRRGRTPSEHPLPRQILVPP